MSEDKLIKTCELLQEQLGTEYEVIKPDDVLKCIEIRYIGEEIK